MSLPLVFNLETVLVLVVAGFVAISVAASAAIPIHLSSVRQFKYLSFLCLLWSIVEFVQLFVGNLAMSGQQSNFNSSYMLLSTVTASLTFYFPVSLITSYDFDFRRFLRYLSPLYVLSAAYSYLWYFADAKEARCYAFPDLWDNAFSWDFVFCMTCLAYFMVNACYVIYMVKAFAPYYDDFMQQYCGMPDHLSKWFSDLSYLVYGVIAFYLFYLSQGTVELAVAYKLVLVVILPTILLRYLSMAAKLGNYVFHDTYYVQWSFRRMTWEVKPKRILYEPAALAQAEESTVADEGEIDTETLSAYMKQLEKWMEEDKPFLSQTFRVSDICKYIGVDRFTCNEIFSRGFNCNFRAWVLNYRLDYAIDLMKRYPGKQIKTVALESGFSSQSVFARSFSVKMGMSCTKYRSDILSKA